MVVDKEYADNLKKSKKQANKSVIDLTEEELYQHYTDLMKDGKNPNQEEPVQFLK